MSYEYGRLEVLKDIYDDILVRGTSYKRDADGHVSIIVTEDGDPWKITGEKVKDLLYDELADFLEKYVI